MRKTISVLPSVLSKMMVLTLKWLSSRHGKSQLPEHGAVCLFHDLPAALWPLQTAAFLAEKTHPSWGFETSSTLLEETDELENKNLKLPPREAWGIRRQTATYPTSCHPLSSSGRFPPAAAAGPQPSGGNELGPRRRWGPPTPPQPPLPPPQPQWLFQTELGDGLPQGGWKGRRQGWVFGFLEALPSLTWPLDFVWVSQTLRGADKHFRICDRRPKRNHVEPAVVPNRSILLGVNHLTCKPGRKLCRLLQSCCVCTCAQGAPGWCLRSHSSKTASVKVCSNTKMGSFGDRWVWPPVPLRKRWARLWRLRMTGSYIPWGALYPGKRTKPPSSEVFCNFRMGTVERFRCTRRRRVEFVPGLVHIYIHIHTHWVSPALVSLLWLVPSKQEQTFNAVPEALWRGGVIRRSVEGV